MWDRGTLQVFVVTHVIKSKFYKYQHCCYIHNNIFTNHVQNQHQNSYDLPEHQHPTAIMTLQFCQYVLPLEVRFGRTKTSPPCCVAPPGLSAALPPGGWRCAAAASSGARERALPRSVPPSPWEHIYSQQTVTITTMTGGISA